MIVIIAGDSITLKEVVDKIYDGINDIQKNKFVLLFVYNDKVRTIHHDSGNKRFM